ncbi:MAG: ATP-binding protein [Nitrospiraceae bacterium]|nr:ATP-binding protein [Nitrospiraceae bacterium]
MSLQKKIILSFLISSAIVALLAGSAYVTFIEIRREIRFLELADNLRSKSLQLRRYEKNFFLYGESKEGANVYVYLRDLRSIIAQARTDYNSGILLDLQQKVEEYAVRFKHIEDLAQDFRTEFSSLKGDHMAYAIFFQIIESTFLERPLVNAELCEKLFARHEVSRISGNLRALNAESSALRKTGEEIFGMSNDLDRTARERVENSIRVSQLAALVLFPLSLLVGLGTLFAISRSVVRRLKILTSAIEQTGKGDFSSLPLPHEEDEVGVLINTFNKMENDLIAREDELASKKEELFQSRKLASIGTLASGVAHELNNPLNNIYLSAQILSKEIGEESFPPIVKETVSDIFSQTLRVKRIVSDLLEFSREKPPELSRLNIVEVINTVVRQMKAAGEMADIAFELDSPEAVFVSADRHLMEQVFINLFGNAADAMAGKGLLRVTVRSSPQRVKITVTDSGQGISPADRQKIFDPFFTTKEKGTGLGLAIVYSIIERHRGRIEVESSPGEGASFYLTLPTHDET